ncbi:hypothetical protein P3G55_23610 [Leptospira sp. 96542]|nr:hypothetical protein [Leptospira sp. 96542]
MKLPYLRMRSYTNKAGQTWVGYYYEPPRGSGGEPGVKPKPVPLGDETLPKGATRNGVPPAAVLAKYSELTSKTVRPQPLDGSVAGVYARWLEWARAEVKADRLGKRTLADYESHWDALEPVFGAGQMNSLDQAVLLQYFDKRSSKDRAKREVNFLGLLCAWARPRKYMTAANPVDRGLRQQMKVQHTRKPIVTTEVYRIVWQCADQLVRDTLDLGYMLATRPTEAIRVPMPEPDATHVEKFMSKTSKRGRAVVSIPMTKELSALIERRRALNPNSLYILFDEQGRDLKPNGTVRSRLYKAVELARQVCAKLEITWVDFTRQQLRPTALTQADRVHGREGARKLGGHTTEKQTAHYIRPDTEEAQSVLPPLLNEEFMVRVEKAREAALSKSLFDSKEGAL